MAEVTLEIGGRSYDVTCRDGEEAHLRKLAVHVDGKAAQARAAVGGVNEVRQLLFAALLLADEIAELRGGGGEKPAPGGTGAGLGGTSAANDTAVANAIERLASRVESFADRLEQGVPSA